MKNPLLAALLASLLLACPKNAADSTADANDVARSDEALTAVDSGTLTNGPVSDASVSADATDAGSAAAGDAGVSPDAGARSEDAGTTGADAGTVIGRSKKPGPGAAKSEEACVDAWLKERSLDRYGHPEGTMYAGGSPLFDERTGESRDRLGYVYARQPAAKSACAPQAK